MKLKRLILPLLLLSSSLILGEGCATTPAGKATQAETTVITSVDVAMQIWHDYVVSGKATQAQVDKVKGYYTAYYNAQIVAKAALEKWVASGNVSDDVASIDTMHSVNDASASLMNLVSQFTGVK